MPANSLRLSILFLIALPWTSPALAQAPGGRAGHVMTTAGAAGVLLVGGQLAGNVTGVADSLRRWDGRGWTVAAAGGPVLLTLPAAAYDLRLGRLVFHGGHDVVARHTSRHTWTWNGSAWRLLDSAGGPGPRDHHAMVYDEARGAVVLYGGAPGQPVFPPETWVLEGERWRIADSSGGPGGLVHHAMAYDAARERVVLYGGFVPDRERSTDVWEWDGAQWHRIPSDGPGTRTHHRMAYDRVRRVVVLFGGGSPDTWTWDGQRWTLAATNGPPPRDLHAMAWDAARERVVMYGGMARGTGRVLADVWEWDGRGWSER